MGAEDEHLLFLVLDIAEVFLEPLQLLVRKSSVIYHCRPVRIR